MDLTNVGNMNGFYSRQYSASDLRRLAQLNDQNTMMGMMGPGSMGDAGIIGGQTLDEIITLNTKEIQRRRSYQQHYGLPRSTPDMELDPRRSSMLEFGSGSSNELEGFQFDPSPVPINHSVPRGGIAQRRLESQQARRRESGDSLVLNTQFQDLGNGFNAISQSPVYQQPLNPAEPLDLDVAGTYAPQNIGLDIGFSAAGLDSDGTGDVMHMSMYSQPNFASTLSTSPIRQHIPAALRGQTQDSGTGALLKGEEQDLMDRMPNMNMSDPLHGVQNGLIPRNDSLQGPGMAGPVQDVTDFTQTSNLQQNDKLEASNFTKHTFSTADTPHPNHPNVPQYRNAYSSSGFDMLGVLMRVATRPNPQINIGAVDMSCAFVVCDVTQHDLPIVYCSDIFERLTGYTKHEILGRNCRFLQAPDGKVQSGVKRKYVDDQAVLHLKNMTAQLQEAQISVINYRKGGQPFMNLLTIIPIRYDSDEMKYFVGFQVDLVEQPTSITNKNPGELSCLNKNYQLRSLCRRRLVCHKLSAWAPSAICFQHPR